MSEFSQSPELGVVTRPVEPVAKMAVTSETSVIPVTEAPVATNATEVTLGGGFDHIPDGQSTDWSRPN